LVECKGGDDKCPVAKEGKGKADTPMINLQDNAYVAELMVGTPP
jgi:hypothetical protein